MCKLFCKPKGRVATEDKNNIVYEIDCSDCEAVYFGESKQSLKLSSEEHKRSVRNCNSNNLDKYEYLTGEDLGLKPSTVEQAKFEHSSLGKVFNKGLN